MKKTFILFFLVALATVSLAQKGSWYVGGLLGYGSTTDKDSTGNKAITSTWAVSPEIGTFLTKSVQLGLVVGLDGSTEKYKGQKTYTSFSFCPTLYSRYFFKITDLFSVFTGLYLNYFSGTDKYYTYPSGSEVVTKGTNSGFGARLGIGMAFALSPRFTAVAQYGLAGYSSITYKNDKGNKINTESSFDVGVNTVGTGSVFNIGLYYTFKK
jgi:hypothetical protein